MLRTQRPSYYLPTGAGGRAAGLHFPCKDLAKGNRAQGKWERCRLDMRKDFLTQTTVRSLKEYYGLPHSP